MAKKIMVQGTMSNAGKSLIAAALCRIFAEEGLKVCPFKSQNMALNSFITEDGKEMGRAQVMQAEAAKIKPDVRMNPILLKPNSDTGSQVIVNGIVRGNMNAMEYYRRKTELIPDILEAFHSLEQEYDIIVIEGAGSPAEINLKEHDLVNMGLAKMVDAPVLLVGDIDRGGVFAQLYGTVMLLEQEERERMIGLVINKFRGDASILKPGLVSIEEMTKLPVVGVVPYMKFDIDDEDSLSERLMQNDAPSSGIHIVVVRLPHMSNYTDFAILESMEGVSVRYVELVSQAKHPDMLILPGSKVTGKDLLWLRQSGWEAFICGEAERGTLIFGICGGYQMLGEQIDDPEQMEGCGTIKGLGLLPVRTVFEKQKHTAQKEAVIRAGRNKNKPDHLLSGWDGKKVKGYELHHGRTYGMTEENAWMVQADGTLEGTYQGSVFGTYLHGFFDEAELTAHLISHLCRKKGYEAGNLTLTDRDAQKEMEYDKLAKIVREHMDIELIKKKMGL